MYTNVCVLNDLLLLILFATPVFFYESQSEFIVGQFFSQKIQKTIQSKLTI